MRTRVTAILVAQRGGEWLDQTIAGIAGQTVAPAAIVAVNNGGAQRVGEQLMHSGAERVVGLSSRLPFGQAVARGVQTVPLEAGVDDWIWLLSEDACPEPQALEHILSSVQRAPSVVVAGPKLVDWDHPERIIELGQSLTRYGSRWTLRRQELDQQQYDHMQDVLGVGPVGMLVRRDVWPVTASRSPRPLECASRRAAWPAPTSTAAARCCAPRTVRRAPRSCTAASRTPPRRSRSSSGSGCPSTRCCGCCGR
jgi:GT2 family glycosyltransferase